MLPIGLLLLLNFQGYQLIEGNLDVEQRRGAHVLGLACLINGLAGLAVFFASRSLASREDSSSLTQAAWGLPAVVMQTVYLWMCVEMSGDILPRSVTAWIYPESRFFFHQFTFAMLPLFHGLLRIACTRPATATGRVVALNLAFAIGAPLTLYVLFQLLRVLQVSGGFLETLVPTALVVFGLLMFMGIARVMLVALRALQGRGLLAERLAILLFALVLPIGGLILNRSIEFPVDFQAWEVYALTAANTAILLFASWRHASHPRLSFCLLCATFPFSLYFFLVFLPYTPLSILAVLAMGAGFLVLSPICLFVCYPRR